MSTDEKSLSYSYQQVALAIIGAGIANAVTLLQIKDPFSLWNTMVGIILLCILHAYAPDSSAPRGLNVAYAATWSFTLLTTCGVLFDAIFGRFHPGYGSGWFPLNGYDISFFVLWAIIFGLRFFAFSFLSRRGSRGQNTSSPQQKSLELETDPPPGNNGKIPTTAEDVSEKKS
jgi:hypothetical protein